MPASDQVITALTSKIEKPDTEFYYGLSYYFQYGKFSIFSREYGKIDTTLLSLDNIYDIKIIEHYMMIIFDTDSTFYYIHHYQNSVSKQHKIVNKPIYFKPYKIVYIGGNKISINLSYKSNESGRQPKNRTLLYLTDKDELIQDLDKHIENR